MKPTREQIQAAIHQQDRRHRMSIYAIGEPVANNEFRVITAKANMIGVTRATFMCRKCRQPKFMQGRKKVNPKYPKDGYICSDCAVVK